MGHGFITQTSFVRVYLKAANAYIQFTLEIQDTSFDIYMTGAPETGAPETGAPETGARRGQKMIRKTCRLGIVQETLTEL